ncbi:hypothetical protein SLA2020_391500 [Shorea laevis]
MNGFSTVDGFVEITENLAEMIKYVANEPSVGLFYVQQHTQNAIPNVITLKNNVVEKSHETTLHTEDLEDSITMVRSMKECGSPIADEMIKDIRNSLTIMSTKQPRRGLINNPSSGFQLGKTSSWGPVTWGRSSGHAQQDGSGYFSTIFKSAKQRASNVTWVQLESKQRMQKLVPYPTPPLSVTSASTSSSIPDTEADELPLSSQLADELDEGEENREEAQDDADSQNNNLLSVSEDFDDFKANKEAKLEEWLDGTEGKVNKSGGQVMH